MKGYGWVENISAQPSTNIGAYMRVKCKICGEKVDRDKAYKVVVKGKNNYYCNESEYKEWILKQDIKNDVYRLIYDIFERRNTNTVLFKEVQGLSDVYTYEKILAYLKENESYLCRIMKKDFSTEYAQIRYFTAILKNNLADFQYPPNIQPKHIDIDMPEVKFNRNFKRKPLVDYEQEVGDDV